MQTLGTAARGGNRSLTPRVEQVDVLRMRQLLVVSLIVVLTLLIARSAAQAEPLSDTLPEGCPSDSDLHTADWRIDRAKAAAVKDLNKLRACQKEHSPAAGQSTRECEGAVRAAEKSRLAWKASLEGFSAMIQKQASEGCRPPVVVP